MISTEFTIYLIILFIGAVLGVFIFKDSPKLRPVVILLSLTFLSELTSRILAYSIKNSNPVYHFFTPIQIFLWTDFYLRVLNGARIRNVVIVLSILLMAWGISNSIFLQTLDQFPDNLLLAETIVLFFFASTLFKQQLDLPSKQKLFYSPVFLIAVASIWFNLTYFITFQFWNFFVKNNIPISTLRLTGYISNYLYYLIIIISFILEILQRGRSNKK